MPLTLSVAIITLNEEANLRRTLESVRWADEIVVVDAGSTDDTEAIAREFGVRFFPKAWSGFGAQKNAAIGHCTSDWVLSLDADEKVSPELTASIRHRCLDLEPARAPSCSGYEVARRNLFLGRWIRHGGYYPDRKLRLVRRELARFEERAVHETMLRTTDAGALQVGLLDGDLVHHAYPTLTSYLEHMNRYSTLGARVAAGRESRDIFAFLWNVVLNPAATFVYNYLLRLGFLDGREGLLLHLYHSAYVSWKYAKAWERAGRR